MRNPTESEPKSADPAEVTFPLSVLSPTSSSFSPDTVVLAYLDDITIACQVPTNVTETVDNISPYTVHLTLTADATTRLIALLNRSRPPFNPSLPEDFWSLILDRLNNIESNPAEKLPLAMLVIDRLIEVVEALRRPPRYTRPRSHNSDSEESSLS